MSDRAVRCVQMDAVKRSCTVCAVSGKQRVKLTMTFPDSYPDNEPPSFSFGRETTIDKAAQEKLAKVGALSLSAAPLPPSSLPHSPRSHRTRDDDRQGGAGEAG